MLALAAGATAKPHTSHATTINENLSLHPTSGHPGQVIESGTGGGTLNASVGATFNRSGFDVTGNLNLYSRNGSLGGTLSGRLTPPQSGTAAAFNGTLRVTSGSGRFKHATGTLTLTGTLDTSNLTVSLHMTGRVRT